MLGNDCAYLYYQHLGDRGRQIYELEANLVYRANSRPARATEGNIEKLYTNYIVPGCKYTVWMEILLGLL